MDAGACRIGDQAFAGVTDSPATARAIFDAAKSRL
jgi:hypothetical protein